MQRKLTNTLSFASVFWVLLASSGCTFCGSKVTNGRSRASTDRPLAKNCGCVATSCGCIEQSLAIVRTGGAVREPRRFELGAGETLTLRQAILESGGLVHDAVQSTQPTAVVQQIQGESNASVTGAAGRVSSDSGSDSSVDAGATGRDTDQVTSNAAGRNAAANPDFSELRSVLENVSGMETLFQADPDFLGYAAPSGSDLVSYLRSALLNIEAATTFADDQLVDPATIDPESDDPLKLIGSLRKWFEAYQQNDESYALSGLAALENLAAQVTDSTRRLSVPAVTPSVTTNIVIAGSTPEPLLIGVQPADVKEDTQFFHPSLVMATPIGDMALKAGDFVYAIPGSQTTLFSKTVFQHNEPIPAFGIASWFNAINGNQDPFLADVLGRRLAELQELNRAVVLDEVCIVRRGSTGGLRAENFYLPLPGAVAANDGVLNRLGSVRPGDSMMFTNATRSPFVIARTLDPIRERIETKRSALKCAPPAADRLRKRSVIQRARANFQYYTRPLTKTARNIFQ